MIQAGSWTSASLAGDLTGGVWVWGVGGCVRVCGGVGLRGVGVGGVMGGCVRVGGDACVAGVVGV